MKKRTENQKNQDEKLRLLANFILDKFFEDQASGKLRKLSKRKR